ncbi:hypothetical protein a10_06387 [Streptomyces acidiscabies]|nr:hypothetical protein a10_06387 [Streptomyces acidiscabies]GAV44054.1 hypothetical protein Saa2_07013 [Streptomyces acidiscabies]
MLSLLPLLLLLLPLPLYDRRRAARACLSARSRRRLPNSAAVTRAMNRTSRMMPIAMGMTITLLPLLASPPKRPPSGASRTVRAVRDLGMPRRLSSQSTLEEVQSLSAGWRA